VTPEPAEPRGRLNMRAICALCVDSNSLGLDILAQMLMGFGVERIVRAQTGQDARLVLERQEVDLMLCDAILADEYGSSLISWLRRSQIEPNRYVPIIMMSGHASPSAVDAARACGSNFVICKPTSPQVLMDRILWVARGGRMFVECDVYVGPDRRWKFAGPPAGEKGRRKSDLSTALGEATQPNLSQDEINAVIRPQKVAL